jgi:hypothetical protein
MNNRALHFFLGTTSDLSLVYTWSLHQPISTSETRAILQVGCPCVQRSLVLCTLFHAVLPGSVFLDALTSLEW